MHGILTGHTVLNKFYHDDIEFVCTDWVCLAC